MIRRFRDDEGLAARLSAMESEIAGLRARLDRLDAYSVPFISPVLPIDPRTIKEIEQLARAMNAKPRELIYTADTNDLPPSGVTLDGDTRTK